MQFDDPNTSDFQILCNNKSISCHKSLVIKNLYIKTYLENVEKLNLDRNILTIDESEFSEFKLIIEELYYPKDLTHLSPKKLTKLYHIADKYLDQHMKNKLLFLINSCDYYDLADQYSDEVTKKNIIQFIINEKDAKLLVDFFLFIYNKKNPIMLDILLDSIRNGMDINLTIFLEIIELTENQLLVEAVKYRLSTIIHVPYSTIFVGKRAKGKSTVVMDLLKEMKFPAGSIFDYKALIS